MIQLQNKRKNFFFLFLFLTTLILPCVSAGSYWNYLTKGFADTLYCSLHGCSIDGNFSVSGVSVFDDDVLIYGEVVEYNDVVVNGSHSPSVDNFFDLGEVGKRWANIYGGNIWSDGVNLLNAINAVNKSLNSSYWVKNGNDVYYSAGNVGVGTTTPSGTLHVYSSSFPVGRFERDTTTIASTLNSIIDLKAVTTADMVNGYGAGLTFSAEDSEGTRRPYGVIGAIRDGSDTEGALVFKAGTSAGEEFMRIDNDGRVGIGVTPTYKFDVNAGSDEIMARFYSSNAYPSFQIKGTSAGAHPLIAFRNATHQMAVMGVDSTKGLLTFGGASVNNDYMVMDIHNGNVGIGTTTPVRKLHVVGDGSYSATFMDGKVGIGTTSPSQKLDIQGNILSTGKIFVGGNASTDTMLSPGSNVLVFRKGDDSAFARLHVNRIDTLASSVEYSSLNTDGLWVQFSKQIKWSSATNIDGTKDVGLKRYSAGVLKVTDASSSGWGTLVAGKVGIGTATPQYELDVNGDIGAEHINITGNFTGNQIYGGMWYHNHTGTELNFAVDGQYYPLFFVNATKLNGFTFTGGFNVNSSLTAQVSGLYQVNYMSIGDGQNNHKYYTNVFIGETEQYNCGNHHKMAAGGDVITQSGSCLINIIAGDVISLRTTDEGSTGTGNYFGGNINLIRIGT